MNAASTDLVHALAGALFAELLERSAPLGDLLDLCDHLDLKVSEFMELAGQGTADD